MGCDGCLVLRVFVGKLWPPVNLYPLTVIEWFTMVVMYVPVQVDGRAILLWTVPKGADPQKDWWADWQQAQDKGKSCHLSSHYSSIIPYLPPPPTISLFLSFFLSPSLCLCLSLLLVFLSIPPHLSQFCLFFKMLFLSSVLLGLGCYVGVWQMVV